MNEIRIIYSRNSLPFIITLHDGLMLNRHYAPNISEEFLAFVLEKVGFENVPYMTLEEIRMYPRFLENDEKDVTVVFSYT